MPGTVHVIQILHRGQSYSGAYEAMDGWITVYSAYGTRSLKAAAKDRQAAETVLLRIVEEYRARLGD